MLKNCQTYIKNLAVFTPQDFYSLFGHFSALWMKGSKTIFSVPVPELFCQMLAEIKWKSPVEQMGQGIQERSK